ncbi:DddA-like double-stranded DNA deaminase toxin [Saccharopolyspora phatthalungensis]|uniref:Nucleic acid/nucleotide deaminase of polymorphic system toxin n=1 Tax=Saccharopolyspora phatthalungensis TaxID=664693 RepID=A0A840Q199_9PSEU|nr:DddA-like double-stranded DNA deaminase toxin [Saccharopolyspora phatthalungensis]MBB5152519.1 hypothetical protein [Saccharopolyspora phatthalungensis]
MSVEDVDRKLATAVGKLDEAAEKITTAALLCSEGQDALGYALTGATDPEALEALGLQETAADQLDETRAKVKAIRERIEQYRRSIGAGTSSAAVSSPPEPERPKPSARPPDAVGVDGSRYPPEAAWAVPELPPRVQQGGDRTVAKIKIGDQPLPGSFQSGQGDVWSDEARQRINDLGIRTARYVPYHVEMRAAAMMVRSDVTSAEVVINNVPCGYQTRPPGCHQTLGGWCFGLLRIGVCRCSVGVIVWQDVGGDVGTRAAAG